MLTDIENIAKLILMSVIKVLFVFMCFSFITVVSLTRPLISIELSANMEELINIADYTEARSVLKVKKKILTAVDDLGKEKVTFLKEVNRIAKELGVDPSLLLIKFYIESKIKPWERNKQSGASGIFQLMPANMPKGMTAKQFRTLTATEQLKHYEAYILPLKKYLRNKDGKIEIENLYVGNLCPAALVEGRETLYSAPSQAYLQNKGLDCNRDGKITRKDLRKVINSYIEK
jgi:hypothetical protein